MENYFHSRWSRDQFGAVHLSQLRFFRSTLQWAAGLFQIYQHWQVWLISCAFAILLHALQKTVECPLTQHSTDHWSWYFTYKSGKVNPCAKIFILDQYQTFGNKKKRRWLICRMAVCRVESWQHELESKKIQLGPEPGGRRKILLQRKRFKAAWCTALHKLTILEFHSSPTKEV